MNKNVKSRRSKGEVNVTEIKVKKSKLVKIIHKVRIRILEG
jgi:hypothetical protein